MDRVPRMDFHLPLSNKRVREFVSWADPSSAATRQREKVGRHKGNIVYPCAFTALSCLWVCYWASALGMHKVLAVAIWICATARILRQRWKSNCLFQSHHWDDDSREFKKGTKGSLHKSLISQISLSPVIPSSSFFYFKSLPQIFHPTYHLCSKMVEVDGKRKRG